MDDSDTAGRRTFEVFLDTGELRVAQLHADDLADALEEVRRRWPEADTAGPRSISLRAVG